MVRLTLVAAALLPGFGLGLSPMARGAVRSWTGGGATVAWRNPANWQGGTAPSAGDDLVFPNVSLGLVNVNDYAASTTFRSITLLHAGYNLQGNAIRLTDGIQSQQSSGANLILLNLELAADQTVECTTASAGLLMLGNIALPGSRLTVAGAGDVSLSGIISGTGGLTKNGTGRLVLSGSSPNTCTGDTIVNAGRLVLSKTPGLFPTVAVVGNLVIGDGLGGDGADLVEFGNPGQLFDGYGRLTVTVRKSGKLDLHGFDDSLSLLVLDGGDVATGAGTLTLYSNLTSLASTRTATISGKLSLGGATRTFDVADGTAGLDLEITAVISDGSSPGGIVITGSGILVLRGANTYSGITTINGGALFLAHNSALGSTAAGTIHNGGTLGLGLNIDVGNEPLTLNVGNGFYGNPPCSWAGPITLTVPNIRVFAYLGDGGVFDLRGSISGPGGWVKDGPGRMQLSGTSPNAYSGTTMVEEGTLELAKYTGMAAISGDLEIGDDVGGAEADVVRLMAHDQISTTAAVALRSSGLLDLNGWSDAIGSLSGDGRVDLANQALYTGENNQSTTFSGSIRGTDGRLGKTGSGTFTLSGNNTHTGYTKAHAGLLLVNGYQPDSPVWVNSGATLGGNGVAGIITNYGSVAPGASPGQLASRGLVFTSSGVFEVDLNGTRIDLDYDQLRVQGAVDLGGSALALTVGYAPKEGDQFIIIDNDGADLIGGLFSGLPEGGLATAGHYQFRVTYRGGDGNDVMLTFTNTALALAGIQIFGGDRSRPSCTLSGVGPAECNWLEITLTNLTATPVAGVSATLLPVTPGVSVMSADSPYANIPPFAARTNLVPFQTSTLAGMPCGTLLDFSLVLTTEGHGTLVVPLRIPTGEYFSVPFAVGPTFYSQGGPWSIPDRGAFTSELSVSGVDQPAHYVVVALHITHPRDEDLDIYLVGPDGTTVELSTDNGGSGQNIGSSLEWTYFADCPNSPSITTGSAPFLGLNRPEASLGVFRDKTGSAINGIWRLVVADDTTGNTGLLQRWGLWFAQPLCSSSSGGQCESCPDRTIRGILSPESPLQNGYVEPGSGTPGTCSGLQVFPQFRAFPTRYADAYTFVNGESNACITVSVTSEDPVFSVAYRGSYNPSSISQNYLANIGQAVSGGGTRTYSFNIAAWGRFVVVVNALGSVTAIPYTLQVRGGTCRPELDITPSQSHVILNWSTAAVGYRLESSDRLTGTSTLPWAIVTDEPCVINSRCRVTNDVTGSAHRFYRLNKP